VLSCSGADTLSLSLAVSTRRKQNEAAKNEKKESRLQSNYPRDRQQLSVHAGICHLTPSLISPRECCIQVVTCNTESSSFIVDLPQSMGLL
jgi:hypothetical protein